LSTEEWLKNRLFLQKSVKKAHFSASGVFPSRARLQLAAFLAAPGRLPGPGVIAILPALSPGAPVSECLE
jgi:hypothetical protein